MQILGLSFARKAIRELGALLCKVIYSLIALLYEVFDTISRANILKSEEIEPLYQRVTLVLTIVMVFYITFEFVKYVVQPDTINDKEKGAGNLVLKLVTVILLIAFVPTIFDMAFKLQERLLDSQIFSKVILGKENVNMTSFGKSFSATMFGMFYDVNDEACKTYDSDKDSCSAAPIVKYNLGWLENQGNLKNLSVGLNDSESKTYDMGNGNTKTEDVPLIKFDGIQAIVVGGLIVYILVLYCIDLGTRYAQLVFLQIMSPIAIMGHLSPKKDNMFSKWIKQCVTTYLDLFIRLFIIYFILLICDVLQTAYKGDKLFANINVSTGTKVFAYIAIILGLLVFAQKAPKMLKELLPNMGGEAGIGFGLKGADRFTPAYNAVTGVAKTSGKTLGVAAAPGRAIASAIKNKTGVWSAIKGTGVGIKNALGKNGGFRNSGRAIRGSVQKDMDTIAAGGRPIAADLFGGIEAGTAKRQDMRIANLDNMINKKKAVSSAIGDIKFRAQMDSIGSAITSSGDKEAAVRWEGVKKGAEKIARKYADGKINKQDFEKEMKSIIDEFNTSSPGSAVSIDTFDFELEKVEKWSKVKTAINEAKKAASEIKGETYYNPETKKPEKINYNDDDIAEKIGEIADKASAAAEEIKASKEYKRAHADAEKSK